MEVLLPKDSLEHLEYIFGKDVRNMYGDALVILSTAEIEGVVSIFDYRVYLINIPRRYLLC